MDDLKNDVNVESKTIQANTIQAEGNVEMKKTRKKNVPPKEFIYAHENSDTLDEVAKKLKMTIANAEGRAKRYRARGIPLQIIKRAPQSKVDIEELKEYCASLQKGSEK
jgi:hypothetical protein